MKNGLHVLTEKPISVSVSQADKMLMAAKKTGKIFVKNISENLNFQYTKLPTLPL